MPCPISAKMTRDRCKEMKRSNPQCRACNETLTRRLVIDLDLEVYDEIRRDAERREVTVEQSIAELCADAASGQFVMVKVA